MFTLRLLCQQSLTFATNIVPVSLPYLALSVDLLMIRSNRHQEDFSMRWAAEKLS